MKLTKVPSNKVIFYLSLLLVPFSVVLYSSLFFDSYGNGIDFLSTIIHIVTTPLIGTDPNGYLIYQADDDLIKILFVLVSPWSIPISALGLYLVTGSILNIRSKKVVSITKSYIFLGYLIILFIGVFLGFVGYVLLGESLNNSFFAHFYPLQQLMM